jgi:carbamoyltransferase
MSKNITVGIGGILGHDGNAAILVDGRLIASGQEERFTRIKHDAQFPAQALADCLAQGGVRAEEVETCVFAEKPLQSIFQRRTFGASNALWRLLGGVLDPALSTPYVKEARRLLPNARGRYAWHHLSHAEAAFRTSPFDSAGFLCLDGKGEEVNATLGLVNHREIRVLEELPYENGLGLLYTAVTDLLGFPSFGSEYKVMGLAPYGEPKYVENLEKVCTTDADGGLKIAWPLGFRQRHEEGVLEEFARRVNLPVRRKEDPSTQLHADIAASIQALFEREVFKMARHLRKITGEEKMIFCGGCAQNCVAAGKLRATGIFRDVFNSPVGGDMGSGLGAALLHERTVRRGQAFKVDSSGFYLGSEPGPVPEDARPWKVEHPGESVHGAAARLLAEGKVVGWVRGRMELGARALGARSILADPRVGDMQSVLNLKVKFRESFRPFAPAVLAEDAGEWFDTDRPSDFMQYTAYLVPEKRHPVPPGLDDMKARLDFRRCDVPSIIHVDYSARLQTVHKDVHPDFYRLITEFKRLTGVPIVINTSFNVSGQPIVRTAEEAWLCFQNTDMDYLVINDEIYRNPNLKTREEKLQWLKQFAKHA